MGATIAYSSLMKMDFSCIKIIDNQIVKQILTK